MLKKLFSFKERKKKLLREQIFKMSLSQKIFYANNKLKDIPITREGLVEVLDSLIAEDKKTKQRYLKLYDDNEKKQKVFDLVLYLSNHTMLTPESVELLKTFPLVYESVIIMYDQQTKQKYALAFEKAINNFKININYKELATKISRMTMNQKIRYVQGKTSHMDVCSEGLYLVLASVCKRDVKTKLLYLKITDDDSKKKIVFDLVIFIAIHKFVNMHILRLVKKFIIDHKNIIIQYDKTHKQNYSVILRNVFKKAVLKVQKKQINKNNRDSLK
jgi:hypothetical protein